VSAIVIDHGPGTHATWGTLYAAADGSGVYRSTDGGATWTQMATGLGIDLKVISLALDPLGQSGPALYAGTSAGNVYRSVGGGAWVAVGTGLPGQPVTSLVVRLGAPSKVFAGTNGGGVHAIPANAIGTTPWTAMNGGLSSLNVAGLGYDPEGAGTLWAATLGRGIFDFQIEQASPPFLLVSSPADPSTANASPVAVTGLAEGGSIVFWSTNRGHAGFATGTNPFNASVELEPGVNLVTITAVDGSFNQSSETLAITLTETNPCPAEVIVNNLPPGQTSAQVTFTGTWKTAPQSGALSPNASLVSAGLGLDTYVWKTPVLSATQACTYEVYVWWTAASNRSTKVPYRVVNQTGGPKTKTFNQRINGGKWNLHGTYTFPAGVKGKVKVTDKNGKASADAVRFVLVP
jgi:hypothetical protein